MNSSPLPRTNPKRRARNWPKAFGSEERVEWIHGFRCVIDDDECLGRMHAAHAVSRRPNGRGGPRHLLPMCSHHHSTLHTIGVLTFQAKYDVHLGTLAKHYAELWKIREEGLSE